jgi:branched-chain amino acid transport system substrate-binding protein
MKLRIRLIALAILLLPIAATAADEKVKIAVIFGDAGYISTGIQRDLLSARLAVEQLNHQGGIMGRQVELIELDNKNTPLGSKSAAQLAVQAGVIGVLGPFSSSHSLLAAPVLQDSGIPMILARSTNPELTEVGDYIFRVCSTDSFQGEVLAKFAADDLKAKTAVVLTCTSEKYSIGLGQIFAERFKEKGRKVLWEGGYLHNSTDFKETLDKVKDLQPDLVFLPDYDNTSGFIIKQARKMGIAAVFIGPDAWSDSLYKYGGETVEGSYYSGDWYINSQSRISREFVKLYDRDYKGEEIISFGLMHDAVFLLADAVKRANSLEPALIRDAMANTKDFHGVTGDISIDRKRNPLKPVVIFKFEKGTSVYVKTIYP